MQPSSVVTRHSIRVVEGNSDTLYPLESTGSAPGIKFPVPACNSTNPLQSQLFRTDLQSLTLTPPMIVNIFIE